MTRSKDIKIDDTDTDSNHELAVCDQLSPYLDIIGEALDQYLDFEQADAMCKADEWRNKLNSAAPELGVGMEQTLHQICQTLIPNGSQIPKPGCTSFITTGASSVGVLANLAALVAAPQRIGLTAFNHLEELSLDWLVQIFGLASNMKGVYSSGGSVANLLALGAARQWAFEQHDYDVAELGINRKCRVYVSSAGHRSIQRACAVLGMGRSAVQVIAVDQNGKIDLHKLEQQLRIDAKSNVLPVAIVANAGATDTGVIDPINELVCIAKNHQCWLHVDGAYGLPGILDANYQSAFVGIDKVDSVIVDPHKWLGAAVGIGATFVRDRALLQRAFAQGQADYFEGAFVDPASGDDETLNSMDSIGVPYSDFGVELSAPSRGVVVWALIKEIGVEGLRKRICRHNAMAEFVAATANKEAHLELVAPVNLSVCCFRYVDERITDLNKLNRRIHRQMVHNGINIPSTTVIDGKLVIRPCFIGARTGWQQAHSLLAEVLQLGKQITEQQINC